MNKVELHSFHIPVMGLGYTIDTPLKVGRFGISSVVSIIEDNLIEAMRKFHCEKENEPYIPIEKDDVDYRAKRITAYLNLLNKILDKQLKKLKEEEFEEGNDIVKYFEMLPDNSSLKVLYNEMKNTEGSEKKFLQSQLRDKITAGSIDVNIMTKLDRMNRSKDGTLLPPEYADAMSALRAFALSDLSSSMIFSAGLNPRLYSYCESFNDFFPDERGNIKKKIILKVSDYRSALIQGKFLAKKGLWVSEFRIESGLNCGGHAFATEGILLGPILKEFREKKNELTNELYAMCSEALRQKECKPLLGKPVIKITVQGGIGTAIEDKFLLTHYEIDGTGWGSPFLLVPEATNVDDETLIQLISAKKEDYYLSHASPLGIPFSNFRKSSSEKQRIDRIKKGRPGSPCYKKFLSSSTEFTSEAICTASREYQNLKIKQLKESNLSPAQLQVELDNAMEKDCLCEGLGAAALLKDHIPSPHKLNAVTICPGPNLAYFSEIFSLKDMVDHIYGRKDVLNSIRRPNMFINELVLYVEYLKNELQKQVDALSIKQTKYFASFKENLLSGVEYYKNLIPEMKLEAKRYLEVFKNDLNNLEAEIASIILPDPVVIS